MTKKIKRFSEQTFASLKNRNYRLYFFGQAISLTGTWMQTIGQGLLVLKLTGSGTQLGIVTALQFLPILFLGPLGGVVADRFSKRHILYITQACAGILALILGILVATNLIRLWELYLLALGLGLVNTFDNPTRQTFLVEMVGADRLKNVVSLNSSEINLARIIGPAIAGVLIATVGLAACFILNGLSYIAVLVVLSLMRDNEMHLEKKLTQTKGQITEGLKYVKNNSLLRNILIMMAVIGALTFEFQVILPLFSQFTFNGNAATYAALTSAMGAGSVIGGLFTARRKATSPKGLVVAAFVFGLSVCLVAFAPTLPIAVALMGLVGFCSINFTAQGNVTLQLEADPKMRGRVMALWTMAFLGTTPIGGPIIGWIGEHIGARTGLLVGGTAAIFASIFGFLTITDKKLPLLKFNKFGGDLDSEKKSRIY
jgi:MFS family permease